MLLIRQLPSTTVTATTATTPTTATTTTTITMYMRLHTATTTTTDADAGHYSTTMSPHGYTATLRPLLPLPILHSMLSFSSEPYVV